MVRPYRRRYLAFKLSPAPHLSKRELLTTITKKLATMRGAEDAEQSHIRIIVYDETSGLGVIRGNHRNINLLRSILSGSAEAFGAKHVETLGISGTLKALERFLPKRSLESQRTSA